ncbi:DUF803-domain-containing protein [Imleria badia]|nr:DUF803-domain-containing protein [Imleria badia]
MAWLDNPRIGLPHLTLQTVIGISVAIAGNVLISLALNLQKLAHLRLDHGRQNNLPDGESDSRPPRPDTSTRVTHPDSAARFGAAQHNYQYETQPLVPHRSSSQLEPPPTTYGSAQYHGKSTSQNTIEDGDGKESDYLHSKIWWSGFLLMNIGETGNFISYAFAPASLVAPLGMFALVANCFFAPLLLNERFRPRDILGILLAVIGATTVVLSSPSSGGPPPVLTPDALVEAITQRPFVIFSIIYLVAAVILGGLSEGSVGRGLVVVDVGLCAVFGGFTVLATKAISTLLTKEWVKIVTEWITYPILAVLVITGVLQIRYLNRALKRFDSKTVIPTQFVFFTLSAVVGSAVLYGDFRRASFHEMLTFLYGCAATFAGVFVIASGQTNGNTSESVQDEERSDPGGRQQAASRINGVGSLVAQNHPAQGSPKVGAREIPGLRHKQSAMSMVGYTPVQNMLLAHTPPAHWEGESR